MVKVLNKKKEHKKTKTQLLHTDEATDVTNSVGLLLKFLLPSDNDRSVTFVIDSVDNKGSVRFRKDSERFPVLLSASFCMSPESLLSRSEF